MSSPNEAPSPDEGFDAADAKIDALLWDFFRAETPVILPVAPVEAPDDWAALSPSEAFANDKRSKWDFATPALLASLAVMLVCGLMLLPRPEKGPAIVGPLPAAPGAARATPAVWNPDVVGAPRAPTLVKSRSAWKNVKGGELNASVTDGDSLVDLRYYDTSLGPVEQRMNVEWTTVRIYEPKSGEWLEATVPTVRVEVLALGQ